MKEFNLEQAKAGKPVCTREGKPARIICWDRKDKSLFPIVALVEDDGRELIGIYTQEGLSQIGRKNEIDLVMASEKHEGWINLWRMNNGEIATSVVYESEEKALAGRAEGVKYVYTIKIEWEE